MPYQQRLALKSTFFHNAYQLWYGPDLLHVQGRRERRMLMLGSLAMLLMGVAWGVLFIFLGNWPLVALDLILVLGGLAVATLIWRHLVRRAAVMFFTTLLIVICVIAVVFDSSTPQAPRTSHLYLLPLSVAALMSFRTSSAWLRHGIALACLVALAFLSVIYGSPWPEYALPENFRAIGAFSSPDFGCSPVWRGVKLLTSDNTRGVFRPAYLALLPASH